ncbi:MAG: Uma2 family endonuclease [Pyrinomonadaceae bacterium]
MVTAEVTFSKAELTSLKYPMTLLGVGWDTYEDISEELGDSGRLHVTFDNGTLTIMPITQLHEWLKSLIDKFVTFAGMHSRVNVVPTGSATLRSKMKQLGVEPDLSYFVSKAAVHRIKDYVADELEMPPDIVVEIDVHNPSEEKLDIYSSLGVPEFWHYSRKELRMYKLNNGRYEPVANSSELPLLGGQILTEFLNRGQTGEIEQYAILTDFQTWLGKAE